MKSLLFIVFISFVFYCVDANPNGLGSLPPLGWNTWCTMATCYQNPSVTEHLHDVCNAGEIKEIAEAMLSNGMYDAGYHYVNLDDCWENTERDSNGDITWDPSRFPAGIPELADFLHKRGFKFGIYISAGFTTCSDGGRSSSIPGSYGHYQKDANTLASWGVDYVKFDWCGTSFPNGTKLNQPSLTTQMAHALNTTGRKMWFNFHCGHEKDNIPQWCINDGNSFRIGPDHHDNWESTSGVIETLVGLGRFARPHAWNDPDMLMTGGAGCDRYYPTGNHCPGQTDEEYKTSFTIWTLANAPILVATDVRNLTPLQKEILLNKELIAVNQDKLAKAGEQLSTSGCAATPGKCQVWGKPLEDGSHAVALFNSDDNTQKFTFDFTLVGAKGKVELRDLWAHKDLGSFEGSYTTDIAGHATVALKVSLV